MAQKDKGPALAITADHRYAMASFSMEPGDAVLLYTDGIIEARNAEKMEFGLEGLLQAAHHLDRLPLADLVGRIMGAVHEHAGARPPDDDICILGARLHAS